MNDCARDVNDIISDINILCMIGMKYWEMYLHTSLLIIYIFS